MRLRADAGEIDIVLSDWWQEFSQASDDLRQDMIDQVREEQQQRQRAPRVHKMPVAKDAQSADPSSAVTGREAMTGDFTESAEAPKKRRRRKRTSGPKDAGAQAASPDA
jgi:poly(A) polymerase